MKFQSFPPALPLTIGRKVRLQPIDSVSRILRSTTTWILVIAVMLLFAGSVGAQTDEASKNGNAEEEESVAESFFYLEIPDSFREISVDERDINKWRKGTAELYLVTGDLIRESPEQLLDNLLESLKKNKHVEKVDVLELKGGMGLIYMEKAPENPERLKTRRLIAFTDKKILHLDFSAPAKDFDSYEADFAAVLKSFTLKPAP